MSIAGDIITRNLNDFNEAIKDTIFKKGINDTGGAVNSLKVVKRNENTYDSVGNDYIEVLDKGRGPGKYAPVNNIRDWVSSKLGIKENKELKQVAFLVNRKIKNEGTAIFKDNKKGLEIDKLIEDFTPKLANDLAIFAKAETLKQLNKFDKQRTI